jgi:outer membrane lipase/esterase
MFSAGPLGTRRINAEENCGEKPMNIIKRLIITLAITQIGMVPTYAQGPLQDISETPPQEELGEVIEEICPADPPVITNPDLQERCNELVGSVGTDPEGAREGLQAMAPEENSAVGTSSIEVSGAQIDNIGARLAALRRGTTGLSLQGLTFNIDGRKVSGDELFGVQARNIKGGAAGADDAGFSRLGIFINGDYGWGDRDATLRQSGFDFDSYGITAGVDYRFTDQFVLGAAFGYGNTDVEINANGGTLDTDAYSVSVYGSYYPTQAFYLDAIVSWGISDHDQARSIRYGVDTSTPGERTLVRQTATAEIDSDQISASLGSGYNFAQNGWTFGPYGRLGYVDVDVDGFRERVSDPTPTTPGSGLGLEIDEQDFTSFTLAVGGQVIKAISMPWGVLLPQLNAEYVHEFENDNDAIAGRFLGDLSGTTFFLPTDEPDRNYVNLSIGASAVFAGGRSAFIQYQTLLGYEDLESHAIGVGLRIEL